MLPDPITLTGHWVTLEPLAERHAADLFAVAQDEDIWRYLAPPMPRTLADMQSWLADALATRARGEMLPFAVVWSETGRAIGSTRYMDYDVANRRLEIGHTWYARRAQRTPVNTECKLLLLTHAFEKLGCIAVEFRTHWFNQASRAAIARLGAKQDGVLRNHQLGADGAKRDTVVFSIIDGEWPAVKKHLAFQLERPR